MLASPITGVDQLIEGGFMRAGAQHRDETSGSLEFVGEKPLPREPDVYA